MRNPAVLILIFISLSAMFYSLMISKTDSNEVRRRLDSIKKQAATDILSGEMNRSFSERVMKPVLEGIGKGLLRLAPKEMINNLERRIIMAGRPGKWETKNWLGLQAFLTIGLPIIIVLVYTQFKTDYKNIILVTIAASLIGLLYPNMSLNGKIKKRQTEVMKSLPDIMDLLTVSVEAGLTLDSALSRVVEKMPGTLSGEFRTVLQEIKVGKSKKEAMFDLADRVGVQDLRSFAGAVIQADQLGVSLGRVLRIQSEQIRQNRKQRIQEKAMKAPIKMLIPMVIFIFPAIFIVLLGPAVINIIGIFSK